MLNVSDRALEILKEIGLTKYEALAFLAIFARGAATAVDVVKSTGIPYPRVYDVLSNLEKKGFIESSGDKPKKYRAVDSETLIRMLKYHFSRRLSELESILARVREEAEEKQPSVWVAYCSEEGVLARISSMISAASFELLLAVPLSLLSELLLSIRRAVERGVNIALVAYGRGGASLLTDLFGKITVKIHTTPDSVICLKDASQGFVLPYRVLAKRGVAYCVVLREDELIRVLSHFYYSLYRNSVTVSDVAPENMAGLKYVNVWRFSEHARLAISRGYRVFARVLGVQAETGKEVSLEGEVVSATYEGPGQVHGFSMRTKIGIVHVFERAPQQRGVEAKIVEVLDVIK